MSKSKAVHLVAVAILLAASTSMAHAGIHLDVGIGLPVVVPPPVYYGPPPAYYSPPPPVYYGPGVVYGGGDWESGEAIHAGADAAGRTTAGTATGTATDMTMAATTATEPSIHGE